MKVLMLSTDKNILREEGISSPVGGVGQRMEEYVGLVEELHVIVLTSKKLYLNLMPTGRQASPLREGGKLFIYPTNSRNKIGALFDAYRTAKKIFLDNQVRLPRPENGARNDDLSDAWVVSSQDPFELGFVGYLLKNKFGVPLQLQAHTDFMSPYFWRESWKNKIRVMMAKWLLPKADGVRVVSERIKRSLDNNVRLPRLVFGKFRNDRMDVSPIFVDVEKIKNAPIKIDLHKKYPQFDFIILMASRLSREKNIPLAISALEEVLKKYPKVGMVIVGEGPDERGLKVISYKLGVEANVIFENWNEDLDSYYKTTDMFLLTSDYEGYGRTIVEAMAAGLPVAMTDVGVAGELVKNGENGIVFPVGDATACSWAIIKMIENPDLRKKYAEVGLAAVSNLSDKQKSLEQLKNSWESLIK